jgi:hypothetical protein
MNKPIEIALPEWEEIMQVVEVKEGWGLEHETAKEFASMAYGVKFHFQSGSPGYVSDVYIIQGELGVAPIVLIREGGELREVSDIRSILS